MDRGSRIFEALFLLIIATTFYCVSLGGSTFRLLSEEQMRNEVKAALPQACLTGFRSYTCGDQLSKCGLLTGQGEAACNNGGACTGCSYYTVAEQSCTTDKPWNALTCKQVVTEGGCGLTVTNPSCGWDKTNMVCKCTGKGTGGNCPQITATSTGVGTCQVVPPPP
jgi:hypothetical protein